MVHSIIFHVDFPQFLDLCFPFFLGKTRVVIFHPSVGSGMLDCVRLDLCVVC